MAERNGGLIITKQNFMQMLEELVVFDIAAENYNNDCFGLPDVMHAIQLQRAVDYFIRQVEEKGYNSVTLIAPTLHKYETYLCVEKDTGKSELDDEFSLDMSAISEILEMGRINFKINKEKTLSILERGRF